MYANPNGNPNTRGDENTNMMMMIKHIVSCQENLDDKMLDGDCQLLMKTIKVVAHTMHFWPWER